MKATEGPKPIETLNADDPDYPCGLRITLSKAEIEKLMVGRDFQMGEELKIKGVAEVIEMSKEDVRHGNDGQRVTLQIKELEVDTNKTDSDRFYGE